VEEKLNEDRVAVVGELSLLMGYCEVVLRKDKTGELN